MTEAEINLDVPRCPHCGALTPPSSTGRPAEWCSQCHARLGAIVHVDEVVESSSSAAPEPTSLPAPPPSGAPLPPPALDERLIDQMLVELKATDTDPLALQASRLDSKASRIGLAIIVGVIVLVFILAVATLAGVLLR